VRKFLSGLFTYAACRTLDRLPREQTRNDMSKDGWRFRTIRGVPGEGVVRLIIHPDGQPLYGEGAPGYVLGKDGPIVLPAPRKAYERRWHDFRQACTHSTPQVS
jgi:hypothetical protein